MTQAGRKSCHSSKAETPKGGALVIGIKKFDFSKRTFVMGILNVTPDSFSDGGRYFDYESAVSRGLLVAEEGADVIDIGGQSTRPGSEGVSVTEEAERVIPVIEKLARSVDIPISIDTYSSDVARLALNAGASMVNDISALRFDENMVRLVAERGVPVCLMHMKGRPGDMQIDPGYENATPEIIEFLRERIEFAVSRGIAEDTILIDPGIGFGKRLKDNYEIVRKIAELKTLGYPLLFGASRKSMIGSTLDLDVDERLEGTIAVNVLAIAGGADIIRVHDVIPNVRAAAMTDSVLAGEKVER